jgi:aminoglycoside phosphotransferase (APT) family kinase protein
VSEGRQLGGGNRTPWSDLPASVRTGIEEVLGAPVVDARSQSGGFSPGSADRLVTADGRRAFAKAVAAAADPDAHQIHRAESRILPLLPRHLPVPRLLGVVETDEWIALVLADIEGRHPATPWLPAELDRALDALAAIAAEPVSAGLAEVLPPLGTAVAPLFGGWARLDPDHPPRLPDGLDAWYLDRLDRLGTLASEALEVVVGDRLVHLDARADNLLVRPDGSVVVIDWPWAAVGAPWFDALTLLMNVRYFDPGSAVDAVMARHPAFTGLTAAAALRALAGLGGFFAEASTRPAPPGLPTLRRFQRDQAVATLGWLRERWPDLDG